MDRSRSRSTTLSLFTALGLIVMLIGAAAAQPPGDRPETSVREQNVDPDGWIAVHEQGVADVNVTNSPLSVSGDVRVSNLPQEQAVMVTNDVVTVAQAPASRARVVTFSVDAGDEINPVFDPPINATMLSIRAFDEEVVVQFSSPVSDEPGDRVLFMGGDSRNITERVVNLTQPIPISGVRILCQNDFEDCDGWVSVVGS